MPDADVQVIIQGVSNLPKDRFINTLHFSDSAPGTFTEFANIVGPAVIGNWTGMATGLAGKLYPAPTINRAFEVRVYNPDDPEPRVPKKYFGTLPAGGGTPMPSEVALCLSYRTDQNVRRKRGRIYLGPWDASANTNAGRPSASVQTELLDLASDLSAIGLATVDWQLVSLPVGAPVTAARIRRRIEHVWCDDAWDTQRRRGLSPLGRQSRDVSG